MLKRILKVAFISFSLIGSPYKGKVETFHVEINKLNKPILVNLDKTKKGDKYYKVDNNKDFDLAIDIYFNKDDKPFTTIFYNVESGNTETVLRK